MGWSKWTGESVRPPRMRKQPLPHVKILLKKVKDLMLKVKEVDVARVKAEEEVIKLKANYETSIKQLVEAQNSAKKIVTMEKEKA